jgi:hypothetical protein
LLCVGVYVIVTTDVALGAILEMLDGLTVNWVLFVTIEFTINGDDPVLVIVSFFVVGVPITLFPNAILVGDTEIPGTPAPTENVHVEEFTLTPLAFCAVTYQEHGAEFDNPLTVYVVAFTSESTCVESPTTRWRT